MAGAIMDASGEMLEYHHIMKHLEYGNEIGRLAQWMKGRVDGTDTMHFIHKNKVPQDSFKDVTW